MNAIYEDFREVELSSGFCCSRDIASSAGAVLTKSGTILDERLIHKLKQYDIARVFVHRDVDAVLNKTRCDSNALIEHANKATYCIIYGGELPTIYRDLLFDYLYVSNSDNFSAISKYITHLRKNDPFTHEHCTKVAWFAVFLGAKLALSSTEILDLLQTGMLHDIGKSCIPGSVLNKEGSLDKEEFDLIRRHPLVGYQMLKEMVSKDILQGVLHHHEKLTGFGYPHGLVDSEVTLYSRVVGIVDIFDALTSYRPYKNKVSVEDAIPILGAMAHAHELDIELYGCFVDGITGLLKGGLIV